MALKWLVAATACSLAWKLLAAEAPPPVAKRADLLAHSSEIARLIATGSIQADDVPDPHWSDSGCIACHEGKPDKGRAQLRDSDINRLCKSCHDILSAHNYIHAVGMVPSAEKHQRMSPDFRDAIARGKGVLTCIGCHDLPLQCDKSRRAERKENPLFFRNGPYRERTELCFSCHNPISYQRLNPHSQISDEGALKQQVCLVCHSVVPNRRTVRSINDVSFNLQGGLDKLCLGCHPVTPHPGSSLFFSDGRNPHLVVPSDETAQRMQETRSQGQLILPLDPDTGKIFCATCHNPHERGVVASDAADRGADVKYRLRVAEQNDWGCGACHAF